MDYRHRAKRRSRHKNRHVYEKCFSMVRNREKYIVQSFDYKNTNGFTEGTNNTIKAIKGVGYGYRNY